MTGDSNTSESRKPYLAVRKSSHEFLDNFELTTEESIFGHVNLVLVGLEAKVSYNNVNSLQPFGSSNLKQFEVDTGHSLNQTLVGSRELKFSEHASRDASGCGARKTDLKLAVLK